METSSLIVKFDPVTADLARSLAVKLNTTPAQVFVKALVLLEKVQGKKIVLKEDNSPITVTYSLYAK